MNKTILIIIAICLFGCKSNKQIIELKQLESQYPIILHLNKEDKKIVWFEFPMKLLIKNNTSDKKKYSDLEYFYNNSMEVAISFLYDEKNLKLTKAKKVMYISPNEKKEHIAYISHKIDNRFQDNFTAYIDKMLSKNKDTMSIGSIKDFKKEHIDLLKSITKDDWVGLKIWGDKNVSIPVKWDY